MRKALFTLTILFAMMAAGTGLKAQEAIIELSPGWTWISYPSTDTMDFATAFNSFTPKEGDYIKSQEGYTEYYEGYGWFGTLTTFMPCKGYMYKSNRTEPIMITVGTSLSTQSVTTADPTDITTTSAVVGGTVTIGEGNHIFARGVCWGTEPLPNVDGNHTTDATVTGSQTITLDNLTSSTTYYVRAYMVTDYGLAYGQVLSFTTESGGSGSDHDYVDLGLPSGTLWATCNIGANSPEEYGDYFAWGEIQSKDTYVWWTYQYCNGGDGWNTLTKYCNNSDFGYYGFTDDLTTLLPEDDAACANWNEDWRMPTHEEWVELYLNTTCTWTAQNGVNGCLFIATNGNSLFLPASGYRVIYQYLSGSDGLYWSSSLDDVDPSYARCFDFNLNDYNASCGAPRYTGRSVRAVRSGQPSITDYSITVIPNPFVGGMVTGGGIYQIGQSCTVHAIATSSYTFTNWTENGNVVSTNANYTFTVNGNRTLVANFSAQTPITYSITVSANPSNGGSVTGGGNYQQGQFCTVSAAAATGYTFTNWTEDGSVVSTSANYSFTVDGNRTLVANFSAQAPNTYTISVSSNPTNGGSVTGGGTYQQGQSCTVTATADAGYTFVNWTENGNQVSTNSNYTFEVTGNRALVANFSTNPTHCTINASANPSNGGSVSGVGTYEFGQTCTLTATVINNYSGYSFSNWTENGVQVSTDENYSFIVTGNRTLMANFTYNSSGGHGYVNLGLPSGRLWATCNVGADTPEDYGDFFAWGEIQTKYYLYNWSNYQHSHHNATWGNPMLIKYCTIASYGASGFVDNLTSLLATDDVANVKWGTWSVHWHMPTKDDWQELIANTTHIWTTRNGVNGYLFTASNGNQLFLPASGVCNGSNHGNIGSVGLYWSKSLRTDLPSSAWSVLFEPTECSVGSRDRYIGFSVRPVL